MWEIDRAHSTVQFAVKHLMISTVRGTIGGLQGTLALDEEQPWTSRVDVTIDVATIATGDDRRDAHLRSVDFFDVEHFPTASFVSTRVEAKANGAAARMTGELTMHGVTREVQLDVTMAGRARDQGGVERLGFTATTTIDRREFGLHWNQALETGGVLVSNEARITIDLQVSRTS
jgi:polyisoprenoid-binding protein YceI